VTHNCWHNCELTEALQCLAPEYGDEAHRKVAERMKQDTRNIGRIDRAALRATIDAQAKFCEENPDAGRMVDINANGINKFAELNKAKQDTESQHTPGPWKEHEGYIVGPDFETICDPRCLPPTGENLYTMDANARLIAAAPDLYLVSHLIEELSTQTRTQTDWQIEFERIATLARAAIAKAYK